MSDTLVLTRTAQYGMKLESEEGTPETLDASDFAGNFMETSDSFEIGEHQRKIDRGSFAQLPVVKGSRLMAIQGKCELTGGSASTEAFWGRLIKAMSFKVATEVPQAIAIGARTGGEFKVGDLISDQSDYSTATKQGMVISIRIIDATHAILFYSPIAGAFVNTDVLQTDGAAVSATASAGPAVAGREYYAFTETSTEQPPSFTINRIIGGELRALTGARASGSIMCNHDEVPVLSFEVKGSPVPDANDRWPTPGPMTGIPAAGVTPLPVLRFPMGIGKADGTFYKPVATKFELDLGIAITPRKTFTDSDFAGSGYRGVRVTDRNPKAKVDPEYVVGTELDAARKALRGDEFPFFQEIGRADHGNGLVVVYAPTAQFTGGLNEGEKDGIKTIEPDILFAGTEDRTDIRIFHLFG